MNKLVTIILIFAIEANFCIVSAQGVGVIKSDTLNSQMKKIAKPESERNWIKFKDDTKIDPQTVFSEHKSAFDLTDNDEMRPTQTTMDNMGYSQHRFQQYYKNVKIEGGEYIVHTNNKGITYAANGEILTGLDINVVPVLSDKQAIDLVLKFVNAKEYMWQSEFWIRDLKERTGKPDTTYYPIPQLVIREIKKRSLNTKAQDKKCYLAYRLDIYTSSPYYSQRIFIDANTGEIIDSYPLQSN